jgi:penicillin-binding protein 2
MTVLSDINKQDGAPELRARARLLYGVLIIVFLGLTARLTFLQIIQGERYTFLSENNRIRIKRIPGTRGMVFDHQGQLLIDSRFDLLFVPDSEEPENTLRRLARYVGRDEGTFDDSRREQTTSGFEVILGRDVDWSTVVAVEAQLDCRK